MTPTTNDRDELDALANLIAHCRDSARRHGRATLAYNLDMAWVAARGDVDRPGIASGLQSAQELFAAFGKVEPGMPQASDLATIRTIISGCLDRARDLDREILVYVLEMALFAAGGSVPHSGLKS